MLRLRMNFKLYTVVPHVFSFSSPLMYPLLFLLWFKMPFWCTSEFFYWQKEWQNEVLSMFLLNHCLEIKIKWGVASKWKSLHNTLEFLSLVTKEEKKVHWNGRYGKSLIIKSATLIYLPRKIQIFIFLNVCP